MGSKFLNPSSPGGLLSPQTGDELTADEESIMQAISAGTYFVESETPSGTVDGANATFTLAGTPNPSGSLELYVNGMQMEAGGGDYSLSTATITMNTAPPTNSILLATYRVSPV